MVISVSVEHDTISRKKIASFHHFLNRYKSSAIFSFPFSPSLFPLLLYLFTLCFNDVYKILSCHKSGQNALRQTIFRFVHKTTTLPLWSPEPLCSNDLLHPASYYLHYLHTYCVHNVFHVQSSSSIIIIIITVIMAGNRLWEVLIRRYYLAWWLYLEQWSSTAQKGTYHNWRQ